MIYLKFLNIGYIIFKFIFYYINIDIYKKI